MRSSDSIGQLASALAKAQVELVNPPKTLVATLEPGNSETGGQSYRYAPLSAGLEIVRKSLGQHELAVIQTTDVQGEGDSSGEWIATCWPVCRVSDMAHPKLMGAALTYARRYSLFALVGIAGEDDLDAPDLTRTAEAAADGEGGAGERESAQAAPRRVRQQGSRNVGGVRGEVMGTTQAHHSHPAPQSVVLASLEAVQDEAALLRWAKDALPVRNRLGGEERAALHQAFLRRAEAIGACSDLLVLSQEPAPEISSAPLPVTAPAGGHDAQATL